MQEFDLLGGVPPALSHSAPQSAIKSDSDCACEGLVSAGGRSEHRPRGNGYQAIVYLAPPPTVI